MVEASREPADDEQKDTPEPSVFKAVEALTKGIEIPLPKPHVFKDKDGHERDRVRTRWWDSNALVYRDATMLSDEERSDLPADSLPEHVRIGYDADKPAFVGHYWLRDEPVLLSTTSPASITAWPSRANWWRTAMKANWCSGKREVPLDWRVSATVR